MADANKLFDLKKERATKIKEARELIDNAEKEERSLKKEEEERYEHLMTEIDELKTKIEREERLMGLEGELDESAFETIKNNPGEEKKTEGSEFRSVGEFMKVALANPADERLKESREMSAGEGSKGGFLFPDEYINEIQQVELQDAIFRPRATVIPAGNSPDAGITMPALDQTAESNMYGGVEVNWIGEGDDKGETDANFREIKLDPNEVAAYIIATDKLLRNAPALDQLARTLLRRAILASEDHKFYAGTGEGVPFGVLEHPATITINRDTADEIKYADVVSMYSRAKFGGSLVWVTNQTTLPQLMVMEDTAGNLIWQPNAREGAPGTLLGIPVLLNERSQPLGNKGDLMLMDPMYYMIKDGFGIALAASEHVHFKSNKTVIKAFWNVDGQPWLNSPIPLEDGETTVSPFIVLDVPAG